MQLHECKISKIRIRNFQPLVPRDRILKNTLNYISSCHLLLAFFSVSFALSVVFHFKLLPLLLKMNLEHKETKNTDKLFPLPQMRVPGLCHFKTESFLFLPLENYLTHAESDCDFSCVLGNCPSWSHTPVTLTNPSKSP